MSKRAQERRTEEDPLAVEKVRPACLVSGNFMSEKQTTSTDSGAWHGPGIKSWVRILFQEGQGNLRETGAKTHQRILKSDKKMTIRFGARGNLRDTSRTNLEGRLSTTILKSQILCTLRKS